MNAEVDSRGQSAVGGQFMDRGQMSQNGVVQPLLTDLYQITMAYAYWKSQRIDDLAVFDLFFRKNPFRGEFTIFAGLEECLKFLDNFRYSDSDIAYLQQILPQSTEPAFFDYLRNLTAKDVTLQAVDEGTVVFPRVPIMKVKGPLIIVQLLETTLLNLVNYASLVTTNSARYRLAAGESIKLLEFGLRRAQGPDGGLSASKYSYIGGFDGTSNVLAGKLFNIPVKGTHAHSYITSFSSFDEVKTRTLKHKTTGEEEDLLELAILNRALISKVLKTSPETANDGELAAMVSYAIAFPDGFMALVDTYDVKSNYAQIQVQIEIERPKLANETKVQGNQFKFNNSNNLNGSDNFTNNDHHHCSSNEVSNGQQHANNNNKNKYVRTCQADFDRNHQCIPKYFEKSLRSGLLNFCAVACALNDLQYRAIGLRIDSGDLAYLSRLARDTFITIANSYGTPWFKGLTIVASNDINEETILSLNEQHHEINCFGIGTHLVTCQRQPALGCVYKLVEINEQPRIKLSEDVEKVTMPGDKRAYRLYSAEGHALIDLLQMASETEPKIGEKVLCRHPFQESKRAYVIPSRVESLYRTYWRDGKICQPLPTLDVVRKRVLSSLRTLRNDHKRTLNPTPYKVSVSDHLYNFMHDLWLQSAPIGELS